MKTIYLTGVPGTGKTTFTNNVKTKLPDVEVISYSELLLNYMREKGVVDIKHEDLRKKSSYLVTSQDINNVDQILLNCVSQVRNEKHIIIDSHAVSIESYGFRATPFSVDILQNLQISFFISLYSTPYEIQKRILSNQEGRIVTNTDNIEYCINLQNSLVLTYGIMTNMPVYFLNTNADNNLVDWVISKINK